MILKQQTSLFTEDQSTFSQEGSRNHVNPIQSQEKEKEQTMIDISGRKCLEQFGKFNRATSWAKMFAASLIGMEGWYSMRCNLTWKLRATKSCRFYFQLAVSTPPTDGIEFGSSLIKTPTVMGGHVTSGKANPVSGNSGTLAQEIMSGYQPTMEKLKMLPTPTAMDATAATANMKSAQVKPGSMHSMTLSRLLLPTPEANNYKTGHKTISPRIERKMNQGWTIGLNDQATLGMLPTPTTRDWKGSASEIAMTRKNGKSRNDALSNIQVMIGEHCKQRSGKTSQLNPRFVEEMMGFPEAWTELPFLNGESNQ